MCDANLKVSGTQFNLTFPLNNREILLLIAFTVSFKIFALTYKFFYVTDVFSIPISNYRVSHKAIPR